MIMTGFAIAATHLSYVRVGVMISKDKIERANGGPLLQ